MWLRRLDATCTCRLHPTVPTAVHGSLGKPRSSFRSTDCQPERLQLWLQWHPHAAKFADFKLSCAVQLSLKVCLTPTMQGVAGAPVDASETL